jgi:CBS domain containing-hemolysin-like protein
MEWLLGKFREILSTRDNAYLEREIQSIIDAGEESGLIDSQSGEMIQSVLEFRDTIVREVMIPRTEMVAISDDATIDDIINLVAGYSHTRMPVYSGSVDNILGILNVKDLIKFWTKPISKSNTLSLLRPPFYIPETKKTHLLLHELKQKKLHMAIVIDEYGGTSGLVTLEDLVEEIIGEIHDEHDSAKESITELSDGYLLVDGRVEIKAIEAYLDVEFKKGRYETLAGLILNVMKKIPVTGEIIQIGNFEMIVDSADERSIKKIRLKKSTNYVSNTK